MRWKYISFLVFIMLSGLTLVLPQKSFAAAPSIHVGYYVGNGVSGNGVSGLPFQPDVVFIKAANAPTTPAGSEYMPIFKIRDTSIMTSSTIGYLSATADTATSQVSITSDGFTVETAYEVNRTGALYQYMALGGSDCTSSGHFCVGAYTGNGSSPQTISSVGFQPNFVFVKRSNSTATPSFRIDLMPDNYGSNFTTGGNTTNGSLFTTLNSDGFSVGSTNNTNAVKFYFFAFRNISGAIATGSFTGDGTDNRSITGVGFQPNFVWTKNINNATTGNRRVRGYFDSISGDSTSSWNLSSANSVNLIQKVESDGFQVGSSAITNGSGNTIYYLALGGMSAPSGSGGFTFRQGEYTGTGVQQSITGVGFKPDLVIIQQQDIPNQSVFKTSVMPPENTSYLGNTSADVANAIISLDSDGFTVGTDTTTNQDATYAWQAFGNAHSPHTNTGAANFTVGSYLGNGVARDIIKLPFSPNLVATRRAGASGGTWRTSDMPADQSATFTNGSLASVTTALTTLGTNQFTLGTDARANSSSNMYWWFGFADSDQFTTGTYTGNGTSQDISGLGFQPDLLWLKSSAAQYALFKQSYFNLGLSQYFTNIANEADLVTTFTNDGFSVGSNAAANQSATTLYYAAWYDKAYSQVGHRFFAATSTADVGAALADQDDPATLTAAGEAFRVRMLTHVARGYLYDSGQEFKLQYAAKGGGTCANPGSAYADVTTGTAIAFDDGFAISSGTALTPNANDPFQPSVTVAEQSVHKSNPFTNNQEQVDAGQDGLWDFALIDNGAPEDTSYCLRIVESDGTTLDAYSLYPEITTAAQVISVEITSDGVVDYGLVALSASQNTVTLTDTQTAQNTGTSTVDLNIKTSNASGGTGWSLAGSAGNDAFTHAFSTTSGSSWTNFTTTDVYQTLTTSIAASASQNFDLQIGMPSSVTDPSQKSITVTVQAVEP